MSFISSDSNWFLGHWASLNLSPFANGTGVSLPLSILNLLSIFSIYAFETILVLLWSYLGVSQCPEHKRLHQDLSYQNWMKEITLSHAAYAYRCSLIGYHPHKALEL